MATPQTLQVTLEFDATGAVKSAKSAADGFDKMGKEAEKGRGAVAKLASGMGSFAKTLVGAVTSLKALGAAFVGFLAVRSVADSLLDVTNQMDALNDAASRLGVSTQFLTEFGYAAQLNGSSIEGFSAALAKLNMAVGAAVIGSKETAGIFQRLGVSIKTAAGDVRPIEDILYDTGDALSNVASQSEKARLAAQLFGREAGTRMLSLLTLGREGMKQYINEARLLGIVLSTESAQKFADFRDSIDRLSASFLGIKIALAENLLTPFTEALNGVALTIGANRGAIVSAITETVKAVSTVALRAIDLLAQSIQDIANGEFPIVLSTIGAIIIRELEAVWLRIEKFTIEKFARFYEILNEYLPAWTKAALGINDLTVSLLGFASVAENIRADARIAKLGYEVSALANSLLVISRNGPISQFIAGLQDLSTEAAGAVPPLQEAGAEINNTQQYIDRATASLIQFSTWWDKVTTKTAKPIAPKRPAPEFQPEYGGFRGAGISIKELESFVSLGQEVEGTLVSAFQNSKSAAVGFFETILSGSDAKDAFKVFIKSLISSMISMVAQMLVAIPVAILFNTLTGGGLAAVGAGNTTAALAAAGSATTGALGATVGSQPSNAKSFPRMAPSTMGQAGTTNININAVDAKSFAGFMSNPENARTVQQTVNKRNQTSV